MTLSIVIPTPGRGRPLGRCLRSIASQPLAISDEVLVVGDTRDGDLPEVSQLVESFGSQFRYLPFKGTVIQVIDGVDYHSYGHEQLNYGITQAKGDLLLFQDDDDVYVDGAFDAVREAAQDTIDRYGALRPMMFRFVTRFRTLLWGAPGIKEEWVGGHNLVTPNIPERLGVWTPRYQGDFDFLRSTVDRWPNKDADVLWFEEVLSFARPDTEPGT